MGFYYATPTGLTAVVGLTWLQIYRHYVANRINWIMMRLPMPSAWQAHFVRNDIASLRRLALPPLTFQREYLS